MSERYSITNKWRLEGPGISVPAKPSAASTPRPAGEAGRPNCPFCGDSKFVEPSYSKDLPWQCHHGHYERKVYTQFRDDSAALQPPSGTGGQAEDIYSPCTVHPPQVSQSCGDFGEPWGYANTHLNSIDNNALAGMNPAAVQAVIDAAREMDAELRHLAAQGKAREKPRLDIVDRLARALASLSTGDAEGGKP